MLSSSGENLIATILKYDTKTTSYKLALLRAINDLVLAYPGIVQFDQDVAIPLARIAELWAAYYWAFVDQYQPVYQGARAMRDGIERNDISFRPHLTQLRVEWEQAIVGKAEPADGFFLFAEMRTPRRRATYPATVRQAYDRTITAIKEAVKMPIKYAGAEEWSVFSKPDRLDRLSGSVMPLPGTKLTDICVVTTASLWNSFHRLSLYIEALCLHEWSLFTESVGQYPQPQRTRGEVYMLLTARPDNRQPLTWERNQINILLAEQVTFVCPWTQKRLTQPHQYDLDHLLPLTVYPINELWNLLPVDREFNQRVKRDRVPSQAKLMEAEPRLAASYLIYSNSATLNRVIREDAALRFTGWKDIPDFTAQLARRAVEFIWEVAESRYVTRF
ncbi:MAG: hypothetical protein EOO61_01815 [Hymenobacter sp.]|nr:MAG: hypothetical protein EOO61_01815 [Hymenobacter sp.]